MNIEQYIVNYYYSFDLTYFKQLNDHMHLFINTDSRQYYILKIHGDLCKPVYKKLSNIYNTISQKNFCPKIIPTINNKFISKHENIIFSLQFFLNNDSIIKKYDLIAKRLSNLHTSLNEISNQTIKNHFERVVFNIKEKAIFYGYGKLIETIVQAEKIFSEMPRQIIHGDLHPNNIIFNKGNIFFIDFDSANYFYTIYDVAFFAYRYFGTNQQKISHFIKVYNNSNPPCIINEKYILKILTYIILQRILFILIENDNGYSRWMIDLNNQKRYLSEISDFNTS